MKKYVFHRKSGQVYRVLHHFSECSTNDFEGTILVIYKKAFGNEKIFVREYNEFWKKFRFASLIEIIMARFGIANDPDLWVYW